MRLPDGPGSQAVLIGASQFVDPLLPDLPAVRKNLTALAEILTSPSGTGLPAENCTVFSDPADVAAMGVELEVVAERARDVLLVYYAGHGLVDAKGRLCLAMPSTVRNRLRWTALEFARMRDVLVDSAAENRILILDCCFAGRAIEAMGDAESVMSGQIDIAGTYTLASAPANAAANAPQGAPYTAFTGELVEVLRNGLPRGPQLLSFNAIYPHLLRTLNSRGLSQPVQRGIHTADQLALAPNHAYRPEAEDPPQRDAFHDPLTGLLNRSGFRQLAERYVRDCVDVAVIRVDLDVFSTVSDALGYVWADRMVVVAGARAREALGPDAPLARLEGATFVALLTGRRDDEVRLAAERLHTELSMPYPIDRLTVDSNALVGYTFTPPDSIGAAEIDALLQQADVAIRATSQNDPVRGYTPSMGQIFLRRFQLVTQFRQAVEAGEVHVVYQPRLLVPNKQVSGVETLVRWHHPQFGHIHPDEFVPAVEAAGLIGLLTGFVLEQAAIRVRKWLDEGLRLSVAVKLSMHDLAEPGFPDTVADTFNRLDIPPELLTFELTESGVMADPERVLPVLRHLHALGVMLAVDNFGTGYSSLAYLRQLPVDEVKIDQSFVFGMGTDLGDLAVVRSIVELGHSLGLSVTANGVEEESALDQLGMMGCDAAQGYFISRPLSESRLEAWLQAHTTRSTGPNSSKTLTWKP
jgi:diguanylate cyclase (GGDEF)-like protein